MQCYKVTHHCCLWRTSNTHPKHTLPEVQEDAMESDSRASHTTFPSPEGWYVTLF